MYCEVDGDFPNHHPDPAEPENLEDLKTVVEAEGADLGLAFDGDGDRVIGRGVCAPDGEWRGTLTNCTDADGGGDLADKTSAAVAQRSLLTRGQTCGCVFVCACERK